jgi:hypothetical protein
MLANFLDNMKVIVTGVVRNKGSQKKNIIEFNVEMSHSFSLF